MLCFQLGSLGVSDLMGLDWAKNVSLRSGAHREQLVAISNTGMVSNGAFAKLQKCHEAGSCLQRSPIPRTLGEYKDVSEH